MRTYKHKSHPRIEGGKIVLSEIDIQRQICKYLQMKGYFFTRTNSVGIYDPTKKIYRKPAYMIKGMPDILVFVTFPGKLNGIWGLEIKRPGAYQSREQKIFGKRFEEAGGRYYVVWSVENCMEIGL